MLASIINKTNVPADLQSAGIKYKDLWSAKNTDYLCEAGTKAQSGLSIKKNKSENMNAKLA